MGARQRRPRTRARWTVLGQIYARTGDAALDDLTARFRDLAGPGAPKRLLRDTDIFAGLVEFERGGYREAVAALEKAAAALPPADPRRPSNRSSSATSGWPGKRPAIRPAPRLPSTRSWKRRTTAYTSAISSLAVFGKARAEEALGHRRRPRRAIGASSALWSQADPGRPEVEEARARLKALSGS